MNEFPELTKLAGAPEDILRLSRRCNKVYNHGEDDFSPEEDDVRLELNRRTLEHRKWLKLLQNILSTEYFPTECESKGR